MMQDTVLGFFGKALVLILLICVPALIINFLKSIRQGSKASNIPLSTTEWIVLLVIYLVGGFFYVRWLIA
ncbi:MAG: hypothetical protein II375_02515 [Bacteroidales bacterium]|nr:hypothetical protein [Bacteroidales bacterium]